MKELLGLPPTASAHAADVDKFIVYIHYLMGALFVGWSIYFLFTLFRFRRSAHPKADYHGVRSHASSYIEVAVALVEAVLLIGFAIPLWAKVVDQLPDEKTSTVVRVIAQQFGWNFIYAGADGQFGRQDMSLVKPNDNPFGRDAKDPAGKDDIITLNDMTVPVDTDVVAYISSKDVIHSFKVIAMRVTQDAIPGLRIPTHFKPTKEGKYQINCAQLCGNGHASMAGGWVNVLSKENYAKWVKEKGATAGSGGGSFE